MSALRFIVVALLLPLLAHAGDATESEQRYQSLIEELRCLVCQNQSIAESTAPLAEDLREQVREQIAKGRSDTEIAEFLTDRYGDFVLYRPPFKAQTWLLWLGPFLALGAAIGAALWYARRVRMATPTDTNELPSEPEHAEADAQSLGLLHILGGLGVLLVFASFWYGAAGSWRTQALVELSLSDPAAAQAASLKGHVEKLRETLADDPNDAEAWLWLGRAHMRLEHFPDAARAFARANALTGAQNPDWLVEEGEALTAVHGRALAGPPAARFAAALEVAPNHPRALLAAGLAALQGGDNAGAIQHWERLLKQDVPSDLRAMLQAKVTELKGGASMQAPPPSDLDSGPRLTLRIELSEGLRSELGEGDTLLVYALEAGGPRMPIAIKRLSAADLPLTVTLDDSNSMLPGRKLSGFTQWKVLARVSASGGAQPQPGDLQGEIELSADQAGGTHTLLINSKL